VKKGELSLKNTLLSSLRDQNQRGPERSMSWVVQLEEEKARGLGSAATWRCLDDTRSKGVYLNRGKRDRTKESREGNKAKYALAGKPGALTLE